jgi:glycosyltransferase involved in cell wall biosynthesis
MDLARWEFALVDNASKQHVAEAWDLSWHPRARHVREDELGLTAARLRGIRETSGELLVFVDDDNVVAPDFLENAAAIANRYPYLGVMGAGRLEPEFEVPPPRELVPRVGMLALRSVPAPLWSNNPRDYGCIPWGAGLVVTRMVARVYVELLGEFNVREVLDRRGRRLFCGGDDLFSWAAAAEGLGFGIFPELRITHLISAGRLTQAYFLRLIHDHAFSHGILGYLLAGAMHRRVDPFLVVHVLLHGIRHGWFSMRCQWAQSRGAAAAAHFVRKKGLAPFRMGLHPKVNPVREPSELREGHG